MRNPVSSEEAAFRFLGYTIAFFIPIAIGSVINTWLGLAIFLLETTSLIAWFVRARGKNNQPPPDEPAA